VKISELKTDVLGLRRVDHYSISMAVYAQGWLAAGCRMPEQLLYLTSIAFLTHANRYTYTTQ